MNLTSPTHFLLHHRKQVSPFHSVQIFPKTKPNLHKSLKLQKSGVACHYNLLPKSPSNHHNEAPTIPSTPLLPKSVPTNSPQSPISQLALQSSRSAPTSSHQVPKPQPFPNDHRSSTDPPQILHQCSLSNQKPIDLLSFSSTEKMKSPVAASPPSMDRSPLQHTNHTTPPTSNESTPKCRQCKSPPTTYEGPPKLHTSHTATPTFNENTPKCRKRNLLVENIPCDSHSPICTQQMYNQK